MTKEQIRREIIRNTPYSYHYPSLVDFLMYDATEAERDRLRICAHTYSASADYIEKVNAEIDIATILMQNNIVIAGASGTSMLMVVEEIKRICA